MVEENMVVALMLAGKEDGGHGGVLSSEKKVELFLFLKEEGEGNLESQVRLIVVPLSIILALGCIL
jgi:hypothetical protein